MIKLRFKSKEKELDFFKEIEKYNYINVADIKFAMMVSDDDEENNIALFDGNDREV